MDLATLLVGDCMAYELVTAREEDDLFDTIKRMRDKGIRRLPPARLSQPGQGKHENLMYRHSFVFG